ncbi:Holliday junction resolvase RuvX [Otoolea muris]|uniref:Holliday junction resolvase RuvX n=1 Tax=Otoolea muris TaxID=2941515 RepID=UPI002040E4B6|nr:Holliday junction resolvase RuvX [Otoolea muris]
MKTRVLGLDFGSRTTGVAVSDPLGVTAQGLETIVRKDENKLRRTCARIEELIREYKIETIVLGYPKNMNNTLGERVKMTESFKAMLERRTGLPVILWDERLTTAAAEAVLKESGVRRENRKAVIDKVAASLILQGYLDRQSMPDKDPDERGGADGKEECDESS